MSKTNDALKNDKQNADKSKNIDMSYCVPARDKEALTDAAYYDFSQNGSEGKTHKIYLDVYGNPTLGVGHLIMPKSGLGNSATVEAYRKKYMALDLQDANGRTLSAEEKYSQFSSIVQAMRSGGFKTTGGCPNYVSYPALGKASEKGVKQAFAQDYDYWYNRVKKKFPDLDKYPLSLQLSLTHCGFAGALGRVKNTGNFVDIAQQVARVRGTKACSSKEREMAQLAVRQCQYLANNGLSPLTSSRENLMAALNVGEPSFAPNYDEMFKDVPLEQRAQKISEYENRDNVESGSVLRGLFAGDEKDNDALSMMFAQALIYAMTGEFPGKGKGEQCLVDNESGLQLNMSDFDVKSENFARDLACQLKANIEGKSYRGYATAGQAYCAGAGTGTLNQVASKYDEFDMGVKGVGCRDVQAQFAKIYGSSGASSNCYATIKEKINANPNVPQVFTMMVDNGGKSASGLHYVTVAPRIDESGEIVRDENGAVKYDVYSFNRDKIYALENYDFAKRKGYVFPITEMAAQREMENGKTAVNYALMAKQNKGRA